MPVPCLAAPAVRRETGPQRTLTRRPPPPTASHVRTLSPYTPAMVVTQGSSVARRAGGGWPFARISQPVPHNFQASQVVPPAEGPGFIVPLPLLIGRRA